jgi:hypothetical protein
MFHFMEQSDRLAVCVIVLGTDVVERYFAGRGGHKGIKTAQAQYDAWRAIAEAAQWKTPEEVKSPTRRPAFSKVARWFSTSRQMTIDLLA